MYLTGHFSLNETSVSLIENIMYGYITPLPLESRIRYKFELESSVRFKSQLENRYFLLKFSKLASAYVIMHGSRTAYHAFAYGIRSKKVPNPAYEKEPAK